jgi:hypothetical protein
MGRLRPRLEKLEGRVAKEKSYKGLPYEYERYFKELDNLQAEGRGEERPWPRTPEDIAYEKEMLYTTIPMLRQDPGWQSHSAQTTLDLWEADCRRYLEEEGEL